MFAAEYYETKETPEGTWFKVLVRKESLTGMFNRQKEKGKFLPGFIYFEDGRTHSAEQHRAIFALLSDIAEYQGDVFEFTRGQLTAEFCGMTGEEIFSLSPKKENCASVTIARLFITYLLDKCLLMGIPLRENGLMLTDDIEKYLYMCLKYKKCCITMRDGEIYYWDTISRENGTGKTGSGKERKICLSREMYEEVIRTGNKAFGEKYHVYGIIYNE